MIQKAKRERSKNLTDDDINIIADITDGWSGKITWDDLISEVELRLKEHYVRQTLAKHSRIKSAYKSAQKRFKESGDTKLKNTIEYDVLQQRCERLEAQNARLIRENQDLLAQFSRWSYNSYAKGVTEDELDKPLPTVDRRQTKN